MTLTALPDVGPSTPTLPTLALSKDELVTYARLRTQLADRSRLNQIKQDYYEGSQRVRQLEISIPPQLRDLCVSAGFAGTALDVLEERVRWDGFAGPDTLGLDQVYAQNRLDVESGTVHLDAFISGVSFATVGRGEPGEPDILVTPESPIDCTVLWDYRRRRPAAALSRTVSHQGVVVMESLYLPDQTVSLDRVDGRLLVTNRDEHGLGRVLVTRFANRRRSSRTEGRSEITRTIRYLSDAVVRTMLAMEVNREFYAAPQRYLLGADEDAFKNADGSKASGWEAVMGRMLAIPLDEEGNKPEVGQFVASSPQPFIDQIRQYAQLLAAEAGIPASYLGFTTENPASADAIKAGESRLISRSIARQGGFGQSWLDVARNVLLVRDGSVDEARLAQVSLNWQDAATPTPAAQADATVKLIAAGVLAPDSDVTYKRAGLSQQERTQVAADKRRAGGSAALRAIAQAAQGGQPLVTPDAGNNPAG